MDILNEILRESLLRLLWIGSFFGLLIGTGLIVRPELVIHLNQHCSRWISSAKMGELLDRPHRVERLFYRHHILAGSGVLIGALIVLYIFLEHDNMARVTAIFPRSYGWLVDILLRILLVGCGIAALVGTIVMIRPSNIRDFEKSANRWISTERIVKLFNAMHYNAEQSLLRHHRIAGLSITLGSLYILVVLGYFLCWRPGVL